MAAIVQPPATQALIDWVGWRGAYVVIGASILAIACPILAAFVRERPGFRVTGRTAATGASLGEGLRTRIFWTIVVVFFTSAIVLNGVVVHLAALLMDRGVTAGWRRARHLDAGRRESGRAADHRAGWSTVLCGAACRLPCSRW